MGRVSQQTLSPSPAYLVAMGVPAYGDGLGPARDEAGDVFADDRLSEDGSPKDVPDGSIRAFPHFLQLELCKDRDKIDPPQSHQNAPQAKTQPDRVSRCHPGEGIRI